jgi:hypothetical protein
LAALTWGDTCDDLGPVFDTLARVKRARASGNSLHHKSGVLID